MRRRAVSILTFVALFAALVGSGPTIGASTGGASDARSPLTARAVTCTPDFSDVGCGHEFHDAITWLVLDGIARGYPDGIFRPAATLTRQAAAAFFFRLAGEPAVAPGPAPFPDVPPGSPFATEIGWFAANGYAHGYGDHSFRPGAAVTRQAVVAWLHRYAGSPPGPFAPPAFPDVGAGHPFADEIAWAAGAGLVDGYPDGTFRSDRPVSRQSLATFFDRLQDIRSHCDDLDERHCFLPFPDDLLTRRTLDTDTRREIDFDALQMPANGDGVPIDPTEWNRNDGFSPGASILTYVPRIDLDNSGLTRITDLSTFAAPDAPIVVIDADTGERHPVWAELDARATSDANRLLMIRPSENLLEGHRYVVALRDLRDGDNAVIPAGAGFSVYRDGTPTSDPATEVRRGHMERVLQTLETAGIDRDELYLAWDFTVASERSLSERMLHMRDDAFAGLGDAAPAFDVTSSTHDASDQITEIRGTYEIPSYLTTPDPSPDVRLQYGPDGLPEPNGTFRANFACVVPDSASWGNPARLSVWQHGLLGTEENVFSDTDAVADEVNTVFCGTAWAGMSTDDLGSIATILGDLSDFPALPDRAQQGILNVQFLARLMRHPDGLGSDPAFRDGSLPKIDTSDVVFIGNSQGGIMGGAATATSTEWTRAFLGVPGMNFSTMLQRSIYWPLLVGPFLDYDDEVEVPLGLAFIQMLWDRSESDGYAEHLTADPYPGTPTHQVMMLEAFGDHQVTNIATETLARTAGVKLRTPALVDGRTNIDVPFWGIDPVPGLPYEGSVLVVWDWGSPPGYDTPPNPLTNVDPDTGIDPHARGFEDPRVLQTVYTFLHTGALVDLCGGAACIDN